MSSRNIDFNTPKDLQVWLFDLGDEPTANLADQIKEAVQTLHGEKGYKGSDSFKFVSYDDLKADLGSAPLASVVFARVEPWQLKQKPPNTSPMAGAIPQQTIARLRNSVCLFVEAEEALGCGFAISDAKVYTAAHLWKDEDKNIWLAAEGTEVQCFYGKLESNNRYTLKITKLDKRLDYCILERVGDAPFPDFLQINKSPNLRETIPVFLAGYQVGLNKDLKAFNLEKGLGLSPGYVLKVGARHFLHTCPAFKGDSGSAIVISDGQVVGIHIEAVSEVQKMLDMDTLELESVGESITELINAYHSGSVALLPSAMSD